MSFQNMVGGGADCSGGANPMSQMLKQFSQDRSLQRDRFSGPAPGSAGPSTIRTARLRPQDDSSLVNEFFGQEQRPGPPPAAAAMADNRSFEFSELGRELEAVRGGWASEFHRQEGPRLWEISPEEEAVMEKAFRESSSRVAAGPAHVWREEFMNHHPELEHMNAQQRAEFEQAFQRHFDWAGEFAMQQDNSKGKGKQLENNNANWEEQFAAFDSKPTETDEEIAKKVEEAAAAQDPNMFDQFEHIWQDIRDQMANEDPDGWEEEFGNFNTTDSPIYKPDLGEYTFEIDNPYLDHPDPLAEATRLLDEGSSSLSETALAFEAAVQRDPTNSEAWMHLGNVQAQNEKEEAAIRALEKAVELDPQNYAAMMSLAVSYINESYDHAAYATLERWMAAKYPDIVGSPNPLPAPATPFELHDRVTNLFLTAARQAPDGQQMDPDVQIGLGVLFYGSGDLDKAVDCFVAALKGRPEDYLLWNRLGATLANSGRSEEAIDAYHKALEIRPSFVRGRYNLGVSCINIGCYKEAAEHLLTGLSMHKRNNDAEEGVNVSNNLWEMLRKTFIMMGREDLANKAKPGYDINNFRNEFEF